MGFNTSIVIMNDAIHHLKEDKSFGERLASAILRLSIKEPQDVAIENFVNACFVVETHHSSGVVPVLVGGNCGVPVRGIHINTGTGDVMEMDLLRELAKKHGFVLRKKKA